MALSPSQLASSPTYRTVVKEIIELYHEQKCLWLMTHKDYFNKTKRYAAVDKILTKYREFDPNAGHEDVVRKINTLRTTYRNEKRRVDEAAAAGTPRACKLWCFPLMSFIDDEQKRCQITQNKKKKVQEEVKEEIVIKEECEDEDNDEIPIGQSPDHPDSEDVDSMPLAKRIKRERNSDDYSHCLDDGSRRPKMGVTQFLEQTGHSIHSTDTLSEDRHDIYCRYLAHKLRDLPNQQRILAERLINDVMFQAEWGNLTLKHRLTS